MKTNHPIANPTIRPGAAGRLIRALAPTGIALAVAAAPPALSAAQIKVTVENLAPSGGNFVTPFWIGVHDGAFDLYDLGAAASPELERIAEDGNTGPLSAAFGLSAGAETDGVIPGPGGPIAPGESGSATFSLGAATPGPKYLSYASMIIPSNDAFIANGNPLAHQIIDAGGNFVGLDLIVLGSAVRDAGTEVNSEIPSDTAFLGQTVPDTGTAEGGVVATHPGFLPGGNILAAFPNADFTADGYQVARITVTSVPDGGHSLGLLAAAVAGLGGWRRMRQRIDQRG